MITANNLLIAFGQESKWIRADWVDLIAALEQKGMIIRQVSSDGLIPLHPGSTSESADWYVNLVASRTCR